MSTRKARADQASMPNSVTVLTDTYAVPLSWSCTACVMLAWINCETPTPWHAIKLPERGRVPRHTIERAGWRPFASNVQRIGSDALRDMAGTKPTAPRCWSTSSCKTATLGGASSWANVHQAPIRQGKTLCPRSPHAACCWFWPGARVKSSRTSCPSLYRRRGCLLAYRYLRRHRRRRACSRTAGQPRRKMRAPR